MAKKKGEEARIDIRVSKEDKELFEYASDLTGAKTLSAFIRQVLQREAKALIEERERVLSSERDKQVFFSALLNEEPEISESLVAAFRRNKDLISK